MLEALMFNVVASNSASTFARHSHCVYALGRGCFFCHTRKRPVPTLNPSTPPHRAKTQDNATRSHHAVHNDITFVQ